MRRSLPYFISLIISSCILSAVMVSCGGGSVGKAPSTEFATFIKAYSGGVISGEAPIRVEFSQDIPLSGEALAGEPVKDEIFSFIPPIKGSTRWISPQMVEFVPEEGSLKPGQTYRATLRLDKVMKISDRKLHRFPFSFMVATKEGVISADEVIISSADPQKASVRGSILLSSPLETEQLRKMVSYRYPGADSLNLSLSPGNDSKHFTFFVDGLQRGSSDSEFRISLKGSDGFRDSKEATVTVPSSGEFRVLSSKMVQAKDPYIKVQLSQPLASGNDLSGIVTLEGVTRQYTEIKDNHLNVYFDAVNYYPLRLTLDGALKSAEGTALGKGYAASFNSEEEKPAVIIPLQGNILPDSKQLMLPFRAVNLKAVDLKIIKIYQDNVLMFLQDNRLSGSSELRRSGRLVYKGCVRLDADPSKDLHRWQNFSVDLSRLFKKEPGAIYRVRLSFRQEYSLYGQDSGLGGLENVDQMLDLRSGDATAEELAEWDEPESYYWDRGYDGDLSWDEYDWNDRDNPLKPTYYFQSDRFPYRNLMSSNIGVIAKYAGGDRLWLSASDIMTSKPLYGVDFEVYSYQLRLIGRGRTDSEGLEEITLTGKPFAVVAKHSGETTYLKVTDGDEKSLSRFDTGGRKVENGMKAYIYGERGVWRPGDTLHVAMILNQKGQALPQAMPATMELYTPEGQFHSKQVCADAPGGFYVFNVPTLQDDPTGIWNAYVKVGGSSFHKSLRIETVKPNRLKVNIDLGSSPLLAGQRTQVDLSSNWLTGPAAAGLKAKASMTLSSAGTHFPGFEGYIFNDPTSTFSSYETDLLETRLDGKGEARLHVNMPEASDAPGMLSANILCSVEEQGGDASFSTLTLPFSPFSAYVGVKFPDAGDEGYLETDTDHSVKVAVTDPAGKRISGHDLEYRIYKLQWSWWWENSPSAISAYVNGTGAELLSSGRIVSGSSDNTIPLRVDYPDWGRYLVYVKDLDSGHASGGTVLIDWPSYRGRSEKTDPNAITMVTFSTDKNEYQVGETATVYVPAAKGGHALLSIENASGVLMRKWVKTAAYEDTPFKFAVTADMAPNFYVHMTVVQPHGNTSNDLPLRMYGVQGAAVTNPDSHLEPVIDLPSTIRPEEKFTVKIKEKNSNPMTYTIAIVDEGLLDLTAFKTPDPWKEMYAKEALGVKTWDMFDEVIGAFSGAFSPMLSIGGDQSIIINNRRDNRFNPVVKFMGPFTLKNGSATHEVTLPMYIGSVRVMVVAAQGDAFGSAEKTVPVKAPLMVLPTLPRVLGTDEKVSLPVNVFATEENIGNVNVSVKAEGPVKVDGAQSLSLSFGKAEDKMALFNLATTGEGTARITVSAQGGGFSASETVSIQVRDLAPITRLTTSSVIAEGKEASFDVSKAQSSSLELSSFPSIDFSEAYSFTRNYAYSCTEQLSARGMNLVYTMQFLPENESEGAREMIPLILKELYSRQMPDGGFGYWPGATSSDPWATSMAGQFMNEALSQGFDVSGIVLSGWERYQKAMVQLYRPVAQKGTGADLTQAYRLYTLALAGKPDNASMNRMREAGGLTFRTRSMLSSAYSLCGKGSIATDLLKATEESSDSKPYTDEFGSSLRDKAIMLEALTLSGDIGKALEVAGEIAPMFKDLYSTQELAFVSVAMSRLAQKTNTGALEATVSVDGKEEKVGTAKAVFTKEIASPAKSLSVRNSSGGPIHASVTTFTKEKGNVPASSNVLRLSVVYTDSKGATISPSSIAQGTDFKATITVQNTSLAEDIRNIALTDIIPSGWEIYNDRMTGAAVAAADAYDYLDIRDDRAIWYFSLDRGTSKTFVLRMRAAYRGEFTLPSISCEAMYKPALRARTASGTATVTQQ